MNWNSEINLVIRNQSLEIRNQVRNQGDLKPHTQFLKVPCPLVKWNFVFTLKNSSLGKIEEPDQDHLPWSY